MCVSFGNTVVAGAQVITVDAASGDVPYLYDGTALDDGDSIDSSGAANDSCTLVLQNASNLIMWAEHNTWVDGGP
jgi:hypothetical protein